MRRLNYGALKLQTLYRQYRSIVVVDALLLKRRRLRASIQIQRIIRGMIARKCADHIREKNLAATCITYAIKCYLAYKGCIPFPSPFLLCLFSRYLCHFILFQMLS